MEYSNQTVVSDGTLQLVSLTFPYIDKVDVHVSVDFGDGPEEYAPGTIWDWVGSEAIRFNEPLPDGAVAQLQRQTEIGDILNKFTLGAMFNAPTMDENFDQLLYIAQEYSDIREAAGKSLRVPSTEAPIAALPGRSERAGKLVAFDSAGEPEVRQDLRDWAVRASPGEAQLVELPPVEDRANKVLTFDSAGQPTAAVPVTDSATELRIDLANPGMGAAMVAYSADRDYPDGSVGQALSVRTINGGSLLATLTAESKNGMYRVSNVTDGPGFNGIARVVLDNVGGALFGYCEVTSYGSYPPRKSVATCTAGVWGEWREGAWEDQITLSNLMVSEGAINASGAIVSTDQIVPICRGSYSWWNEPQSIQLGNISQKMVVGAVSLAPNSHKLVQFKATGNTNQTELAYMPDRTRYVADEHNGPVTIEAGSGIVSFFPGHNDRTYLPYWVGNAPDISSLGTKEFRIEPDVGSISYAQAWYTDHIPTQAPRVWCAFRAGGATGANRTWYITWSENWDAAEPVWTTHPLVTDTDQMYLRMVWRPDRTTPIVRFIGTKNSSYDTTNGLWFGYVDLRTGEIKTSMGAVVGELDDTPVQLTTDLTKIYSAPRRIRLYDALGDATSVPMLISTFAGRSGGPYRYVRYDLSTWSISHDVEIVASGPDMQTGSYYFGGAHFSNVTEGGVSAVGPGPIYVARSSGGMWLLEEYSTADGGNTWSLARVIDSSTTEKIWRPRVPYNTRQRYQPRQVVLTYCKGQWATYQDFDSTVYAVMRTVKALG